MLLCRKEATACSLRTLGFFNQVTKSSFFHRFSSLEGLVILCLMSHTLLKTSYPPYVYVCMVLTSNMYVNAWHRMPPPHTLTQLNGKMNTRGFHEECPFSILQPSVLLGSCFLQSAVEPSVNQTCLYASPPLHQSSLLFLLLTEMSPTCQEARPI